MHLSPTITEASLHPETQESSVDYPNLARAMTLSGRHQLSVADITYIRLQIEFISSRLSWTRFPSGDRLGAGQHAGR